MGDSGVSFDGIARHYRWLEAVLAGNALQRVRTAFLDRSEPATTALLLGEGAGRFLAPFLQVNRSARVTCVEESGEMIRRMKRTLQSRGIDGKRVDFVQEDARQWTPPSAAFDLIVSHFFLDCFTRSELELLVPRIAASGRETCTWLIADFQIPPFGVKWMRAQLIHWLMYTFFRIVADLPARRLTPPDPFLRQCGFRLANRVTAQWDLLHSDCWVRRRSEKIPPSDR